MKRRLQFRHHDVIFTTRDEALNFFSDILDTTHPYNEQFGTSLYAEPMVAKYFDVSGRTQVLFAIGVESGNTPYHIIDSAHLVELIETNQEAIKDETNRAIAAEAALSAAIETEIARAIEVEQSLSASIETEITRAMSAETALQQQINDNVATIVPITENLGANIREEYALKNAKGEELGEHIKIYKDSALVGAAVDFKGATGVTIDENNKFIFSYDADVDKNVEYLYLVYRNEKGELSLVALDFENFLMETEEGFGIKIIDHKITINIKSDEKYLKVTENGLQTINIDEAIAEAVNEEKLRAEAEAKANKINSKDVVLSRTEEGTTLTIQTDEVTITKKANADIIYDTNIAVFGTLLKIKKVEPTNTSIKSRYELQGADGKQIGDAIELPVESALIDVRQGKLGASVNPITGSYTEGVGDVTMDFIYRLNDGTYKLVQIVVSEYFTDSHFGRGLNNQDGVVSLVEGDGNEFLVIGEDTIAVVGVNAAIETAKNTAIETADNSAKSYVDTKVSDLTNYVDTFVVSSIENETNRAIAAEENLAESINNEANNRIAADSELSNKIDNEINERLAKDSELLLKIDNEILERTNRDTEITESINNEVTTRINEVNRIETLLSKEIQDRKDAEVIIKADAIDSAKSTAAEEVAKIVDGADSSYDTLKEIAEWIVNDTTGSAQMANDIQQLKNNVTTLTSDKTVAGSVENSVISGIDDAMIINGPTITVTTPEDASNIGSLLRKVIVTSDGDAQYYVSNRAIDMLFVPENGTPVNLNTYITSLEEKIKTLEEKIEDIEVNGGGSGSGSGGGASVSADEVKEIIREYLAGVQNEIDVKTNEDNSKLLIGFADDAIFG